MIEPWENEIGWNMPNGTWRNLEERGRGNEGQGTGRDKMVVQDGRAIKWIRERGGANRLDRRIVATYSEGAQREKGKALPPPAEAANRKIIRMNGFPPPPPKEKCNSTPFPSPLLHSPTIPIPHTRHSSVISEANKKFKK